MFVALVVVGVALAGLLAPVFRGLALIDYDATLTRVPGSPASPWRISHLMVKVPAQAQLMASGPYTIYSFGAAG